MRTPFAFPLPEDVAVEVAKTDSIYATPAWARYTHPYREFWDVKEDDRANISPWTVATLDWWEECNRPLFDALKKEVEETGLTDTERALLFHLNQAFDDLRQIVRVAGETWRHDPVYEFIKTPDKDGCDNSSESSGNVIALERGVS